MKVRPRSMALRTSLIASASSTRGSPRCQPPRPMSDTRSPVCPSTRVGISLEDAPFDMAALYVPRRARPQYPDGVMSGSDEILCLNGIDASTGDYLVPPLTVD